MTPVLMMEGIGVVSRLGPGFASTGLRIPHLNANGLAGSRVNPVFSDCDMVLSAIVEETFNRTDPNTPDVCEDAWIMPP